MAEHPGKRSDPGKLAKDREAIRRSQAAQQVAPQAPDALSQAVDAIKQKIAVRRGRRMGYGAAPQKQGAMVTGIKPPEGLI